MRWFSQGLEDIKKRRNSWQMKSWQRLETSSIGLYKTEIMLNEEENKNFFGEPCLSKLSFDFSLCKI
jgi:hypothetical protein